MLITSKGQITIPINIRNQLGLLPHTEVDFEIKGDRLFVKKAANTRARGRTLIDHMKGKASHKLSTDEIMAMTRKLK